MNEATLKSEQKEQYVWLPRPTLVVGGAGFIGSHTVEALLACGCQVRVLDDLSTGSTENLPLDDPNLEVIVGDIVNRDIVRDAMRGMSFCIHLAAQVSAARSVEDPFGSAMYNILGFVNVLEAAREMSVQRLVYASSAAVYGDCAELPLSEDVALKPVNPYGLEKLVDEEYADLYARLHGTHTLGLRYFNVYGPRQLPNSPYSGVISKFVEHLRTKKAPVIYGDGRQTRDFVAVKDVALANIAALASDYCGVCNVATGTRVDLWHLMQTLNNLMGSNIEADRAPARAGDIKHSCGDDRRLRQKLGIVASTRLDVGLQNLIEYLPQPRRRTKPAVSLRPAVRGKTMPRRQAQTRLHH